ncbi:phage portal protein [Mycolicibacterium mucogenicum]|uniref:Phage portal protein n=1 Tax=Mycolicibacterium mucogenicum DSM 44124 TaxID=1226753 RepID=A0A8H2JHV8_MYCMU|nr:phage portal protein [Mycolicibacterium mucogenicum]KAB7755207.1 portal protein [Mycolicibacterium mucogenicum DSM 44124]QPG68894.1 phage portal protein [Mycolicibacterium mucogenicum DSM 44124]
MTVAIALPTLHLSDSETESVGLLRAQLVRVTVKNKLKSDLYESKRNAEDLGISIPDGMDQLINAVIGWPGTVVDVLEERLDFLGWTGDDGLNLGDVYDDNQLAVESGRCHLDTLIYGCGFVAVGRGDTSAGEPEILVSVESTESCTVEWDYRLRRAKSALSQTRDAQGVVQLETLYLPNETIRFERRRGELVVADRDPHKLGRVPVVRILNRDRASDVNGRSEITRAVEYYTYAALRTLTGLEVNREFYTSPKWSALNADPEVFGMSEDKSPKENRKAGFSATQGRLNVIPPQVDENGDPVEVTLHEFRPAPPTPYIDQVKLYSQLLAAESGMPAPYLGFVTDNPASADSIRQQEYRLVKRAERRQTSSGLGWREIGYLSLLFRDGSVDLERFRQVSSKWRDASTPTRAAAADEATKLIGAEVLPPDSVVTYDRIGLSQQEQAQLDRDRRRGGVATLVGTLTATAPAEVPASPAGAADQIAASGGLAN